MSILDGLVRRPLVQNYIDRYTTANMEADVRVTRGSYAAPVAVYTGRARIAALGGSVQMGFGDEPQYMVSGTISLPTLDSDGATPVEPMVNDMILVLRHHDPSIVGRSFRVMHVDNGNQYASVVRCTVLGAEVSPTTDPDPLAPITTHGPHDYEVS